MSDTPPSNKPIKTIELSEASSSYMDLICKEILRNGCDWTTGRGPTVLEGESYFITYSINIYRPALAEYKDKK